MQFRAKKGRVFKRLCLFILWALPAGDGLFHLAFYTMRDYSLLIGWSFSELNPKKRQS
jgi:hypothetical protein